MKTLPLAHRNDPVTSYIAADKLVKSGRLSRQERRVFRAIEVYCCFSNFTARGLSNYCGLDYYLIQRRLSGLKNKGKIERTGKKRNGQCVWRLK